MSLSLLHRRADVGKSAREFFRFESASVRGRAHRKDLTRICLIAETSPALSFAAWRTTMRGHTHRLRGSVVVGLSPHLRANGLRPRADCLFLRQVSLGRLGCGNGNKGAADIQIHSGLRGAGSLPFHRGSAVCQDLRRDVSNALHVSSCAVHARQLKRGFEAWRTQRMGVSYP